MQLYCACCVPLMYTVTVQVMVTSDGMVTVKLGVMVAVDPNVPEPVPCQYMVM